MHRSYSVGFGEYICADGMQPQTALVRADDRQAHRPHIRVLMARSSVSSQVQAGAPSGGGDGLVADDDVDGARFSDSRQT